MVAAVAITTFARGVPFPLVTSWDDGRFLVDFEEVRSITWAHFVSIVSEPHFEAWHPMHLLSYWIDVPWAGPNGPVVHAVNLALFVVALLVVLELFRALGLSLGASVLATLALGVHPVQVEAVTWATGRKDVLALGFGAAAFLAHVRSERFGDRAAWLSRGLFVLAATSKASVLPLPAVLFAADMLIRGVPFRAALVRQLPTLAIAGALGIVTLQIWEGAEMIRAESGTTLGSPALVAATISHHLATAFFPVATSPIYPIDRGGDFPMSVWLGPLLLVLGYVGAHRAGAKRACFAIVAFVILLLPVSNVIPVYFQYQDRYLSLPLLGIAFGFGAAFEVARERFSPRLATGVASALLVALALRTVAYVGVWGNEETLWRHAVATHPTALYAWMKLGERRREAGDLAGAIRAYEHAVAIAPDLRLPNGALFYAVLLADIERYDIEQADVTALSARYLAEADEPERLRMLASELAEAGFRRAVTMVLGRSFDIEPMADERLEQAAVVQHRLEHAWLARFYVSRMTRPSRIEELAPYTE